MKHYEIVPALPEHVPLILDGLRAEERAEIAGLGFTEAEFGDAIMSSLQRSLVARAAFLGSEIAALGGVVGSFLDYELGGWLLTTPLVMRYPLEFVRGVRTELRRMADRPVLAHCARFHQRGLRFLQTVGFTIGEVFPAPTGEVFHELRFQM